MVSSSNPFKVDTHEYRLARLLDESPPTFAKVTDTLYALGWRIVYEESSRELQKVDINPYVTYFLAPSAVAKEGGYKQTGKKKNIVYVTINRDTLEEGVDFFNLDNKKSLYDFLLCNGFALRKAANSNDI